jgi:hypothetical protein
MRPLGWLAIGSAVLETMLLHNTYWLHLPPGRDPLDRARGFQAVAQRAAEISTKESAQFFITDKYSTASLLTFYLPGHPDTYLPPSTIIEDQYSIWPGYRQQFQAGSGVFISDSKKNSKRLKRDFAKVKLLEEVPSTYRDRKIATYYIYLCRDLRATPLPP